MAYHLQEIADVGEVGRGAGAESVAPAMPVEASVRYGIKRGFQKSHKHGQETVPWRWGSIQRRLD